MYFRSLAIIGIYGKRLPTVISSYQRMMQLSTLSKADVISLLKSVQCVCFDVDSTVIQEEGIDVLAASLGVGDEVAELTRKAMGGHVPFDQALSSRLSLMKPPYMSIQDCLSNHPFQLTPGIEQVIQRLHQKNVHVYLVSGGFRQMINPIAAKLNIPRHRIYANNLLFSEDGEYKGFDTKELTSRDGGKTAVIQRLKELHGYTPIVMIGDGATDMQARPPADAFIGFGGVAVRKVVEESADWFITDFKDLIDALE